MNEVEVHADVYVLFLDCDKMYIGHHNEVSHLWRLVTVKQANWNNVYWG